MDKKVFRDISYGMYLVSAKEEKEVGCIINTLTQITSENPMISICINKENYTNQVIQKTKKFIVSILSEKINSNVISTFGFQSSKETEKFSTVPHEEIEGIPILSESICGYLVCKLIQVVDVGTHDIFIAQVVDTKKLEDSSPMTYQYYHEVIKGKAPKKAPTYEEEKVGDDAWICDVCGYVHQGELPEDFRCPICGMDASHFKKKDNL